MVYWLHPWTIIRYVLSGVNGNLRGVWFLSVPLWLEGNSSFVSCTFLHDIAPPSSLMAMGPSDSGLKPMKLSPCKPLPSVSLGYLFPSENQLCFRNMSSHAWRCWVFEFKALIFCALIFPYLVRLSTYFTIAEKQNKTPWTRQLVEEWVYRGFTVTEV